METSIKKLPNSRVEIFFKIPKEEFEKFREKSILKFGQELKTEGFRPGKAPKEVIEKEIGEARILEEAVRVILEGNYPKVVLENKIEPITQPEVEVLPPTFSKSGGLTLKASLTVFPEIKLPDYKKIASQIKRNKVLVEEAEIEDALCWLQKSRAKFTLKNKPAEKGDFLEIDFSSPQIEAGLKRKDGFILGEGQFIPGFEENLIGMTNGEAKDFSLKFPKNHFKKDMAGKNFDFKVRVRSVQTMELPEVSDEWAKSLGNFNDLVALKNNLKEGINIEKEMAENQRVRQEILEKLGNNSKIEIPEILIEREKNIILDELKEKIAGVLKMPFEEYLTKIKKTEKEVKDSFLEEAQKRAKYNLILREISILEEIGVSEEEIKDEMNKLLKSYSIEKIKELDLEKLKLYIESEIKKEKTLAKLESFTNKTANSEQ
jgi:trigger factor